MRLFNWRKVPNIPKAPPVSNKQVPVYLRYPDGKLVEEYAYDDTQAITIPVMQDCFCIFDPDCKEPPPLLFAAHVLEFKGNYLGGRRLFE